jgi:tetratricopeptide (TPR) repeat protein
MRKAALPAVTVALALFNPGALAHPGVEEALRYFDSRIQQSPRDQSLHVQRGVVYSNDGQYEKARADFLRAAELGDPLLVSLHLGVLHYRTGDFAAARRYFDACLQRLPDSAACLEHRARLSRDAGDPEGAIADFSRVLALESRPDPGTYVSLADMLASRGDEGVVAALDVLDQANAKLGVTPQIQRKAIALELRREQPGRALERMRELEPTLGASPDWKVEVGELLLATGRRDEARVCFRTAVDQLGGLRLTPARQQLLHRAQNHLNDEAGDPASGFTARSVAGTASREEPSKSVNQGGWDNR